MKHRSKNAPVLVQAFLERISVSAFDRYQRDITELVRANHGVYALYKNDRLYYVGLAVNLRRRIKQHLRDRHARRWNLFSLYLVRRVDHIREIESLMLRIASPSGNSTGGKLRKANNLQPALRKSMLDRAKGEIEKLFRRPSKRVARSGRDMRTIAARKAWKTRRGTKAAHPLKGLLSNKRIYGTVQGKPYKAIVWRNGGIFLNGKTHSTPSAAAVALTGKPTNGWRFWKFRKGGHLLPLADLRR